MDAVHERGDGVEGLAAAAQNGRVAAFDAQGGGVHRRVGPRLENHGHHAEGHAHAPHQHAVGALLHGDYLAHGVAHGRHLAAAAHHGVEHLVGDGQAVQPGLVEPADLGGLHVAHIGGLDLGGALGQKPGQILQRLPPGRALGGGEPAGGGARVPGDAAHLRGDVHASALLRKRFAPRRCRKAPKLLPSKAPQVNAAAFTSACIPQFCQIFPRLFRNLRWRMCALRTTRDCPLT